MTAWRKPRRRRIFGLLDRQATVAKPGFSRWLVPPAALVHPSVHRHGLWFFSVFKLPMTKCSSASSRRCT